MDLFFRVGAGGLPECCLGVTHPAQQCLGKGLLYTHNGVVVGGGGSEPGGRGWPCPGRWYRAVQHGVSGGGSACFHLLASHCWLLWPPAQPPPDSSPPAVAACWLLVTRARRRADTDSISRDRREAGLLDKRKASDGGDVGAGRPRCWPPCFCPGPHRAARPPPPPFAGNAVQGPALVGPLWRLAALGAGTQGVPRGDCRCRPRGIKA